MAPGGKDVLARSGWMLQAFELLRIHEATQRDSE